MEIHHRKGSIISRIGEIMTVKKKWYDIVAPEMFDSKEIGQTPAIDSEHLIGRTIETNTIELSGDHSRFFIKIKLKIIEIDGKKAKTKFMGHECLKDRVTRMIRKRSTKIEILKKVKTKDGKAMHIKMVAALPNRVKTNVEASIRKKIEEEAEKEAEKLTLEEMAKSLIDGIFGRKLENVGKKIYPFAGFEIRKSELLESQNKKPKGKAPEKEDEN